MQNQIDSSEHLKSHYYTAGDGHYFRLSPTAWKIISGRESGRSFEELAQQLSHESQQEVTAGNVEQAWRYLQSKVQEIKAQSTPLRSGFWLKLPLLSSSLVTNIAGWFWPAFHPAIATALLSFIAVAGLIFYGDYHRVVATFRLGDLVTAYLLYLFSTLLHELGHASACRYFGAQPSAIGFTLYLIYPAFYSDVSDAWRLRRWQRIIVDLSGMYFQLVIGAAYAIAWQYSGWRPFRIAIFGILAACLFNLNPILRFDGYWLLSDLLGITNLGRQPFRLARNLILSLRSQQPLQSPWPFKITLFLYLYSIVWFAFVGWFVWRIAPFVFASFGNYPRLLQDGLNALHSDSPDFNPRPFLSLLLATVVILAVCRLLWGFGLRAVFRRLASNIAAHIGKR